MGFFTKPADGPLAALTPLSIDRVAARFDADGINYGRGDGDLFGRWDDHPFEFTLAGNDDEYLHVRGRWERDLPAAELGRALEAVNAWNADHLWPKGYVRAEDAGLSVYAEHTVDYEPGVSDEQISVHVRCAIATSLQLFDSLDETFPQAAAEGRERIARMRDEAPTE